MSRVNVHRNLPPLRKAIPRFAGFSPGKSHQQTMTELLQKAAENLRLKSSQPFYSMREVAAFFKVAVSNILPVYQALENQGILSRIRGSRTILMGRNLSPRESTRGVVGLLIWLLPMSILPYTQTFVLELGERLRKFGYRMDAIFHRHKVDEADPDFALSLLSHRLDAVVLHTPTPESRQNLCSLRERGIRLLVLTYNQKINLPALIYPLDYAVAHREMAAHWRQRGISRVWIWTHFFGPNPDAESVFTKALLSQGLEIEFLDLTVMQMLKRVRRGNRKKNTVVVFRDALDADSICNSDPQGIESISRLVRMGFFFGRIRSPYLQSRKVLFDIASEDPVETVKRLAEDIRRLSVIPDGLRPPIVARFYEQAVL